MAKKTPQFHLVATMVVHRPDKMTRVEHRRFIAWLRKTAKGLENNHGKNVYASRYTARLYGAQ